MRYSICGKFNPYAKMTDCGISYHASDPATDKNDMQTETLLAALWNETPTKGSNHAADILAEATRERLESGDLIPAGNNKNVERAYWAKDEKE